MAWSVFSRNGGSTRPLGWFGAVASALLVAVVGLSLPAQAASSYTFNGLQWGSSPAEASKQLRKKGFRVSKLKSGPATEYAQMHAWLDIRKVDRGKRMSATGKFLGEKVVVDLVFGFNNQLERINVRTPLWDQTQKGGKKMTRIADKLATNFEKEYGMASEKETPYGFVDRAVWLPANDGSNMQFFMRGTEGFMFYPPHKTVLNISYWNSRFGTDSAAIASTGSGGGQAYPVNNPVQLEQNTR